MQSSLGLYTGLRGFFPLSGFLNAYKSTHLLGRYNSELECVKVVVRSLELMDDHPSNGHQIPIKCTQNFLLFALVYGTRCKLSESLF
jgi:hypothetical protein